MNPKLPIVKSKVLLLSVDITWYEYDEDLTAPVHVEGECQM